VRNVLTVKKRQQFNIQINAINDTDNPTKKEVEFILHDFDVSWNYAFIKKETAEQALHSLKDAPIVCKYYPVSESGADDDALGSHEMYIDEDRESGTEMVAMNTVPIGVFTEDAYIKTIEENGEEKEVVAGKGVLWASRFPNVVGLLKEWVDKGITVSSSMEILFDSYKVEDGITEILSYVYEGHCILQSVDNGDHNKIYPAYDVSKLTKLVAEAMNQENRAKQENSNEEGENMKTFKKVFELSHDDIRTKLYNELDATLGERVYSWIADAYDTYFVANIYSYAEGNEYDKYFKFNYTTNETGVDIDFDSKTEVFLKRNWEEVVDEEIQTQLNQKDEKISTLETQLNETTESVNTLKSEKETVQNQFNEASNKITQLNSKVEELTPYKEQVDTETYEQSLNEKKDLYEAKFEAIDASEKFKSEEVQALIVKSVNANDEGKDATYQLNSLLVDMVQVKTTNQETPIREVSSKREKLIPDSANFESRYSE
jgi:hypothetical protein